MPLYEYECTACDERFERIQKFSDPPVDTCPSCGGKVRKLLSSPAIQFKGSGWYITDYAKKGAGKASTSADTSESRDKDKDKDKKDTPADKPAAKSAEPAKSE
jgi:putative FmdB family regulatory protein